MLDQDTSDPCESVACRTGAEPVGDKCVCTCNNDHHYYDDDDGCAQCHNDDHCDDSQACQSRQCVDPCLNHCVSDAECRVRNHQAECYCSDDTPYSAVTGCASEGKSLAVDKS